MGNRGHNDEWVRVIGVVKDMHSGGLERLPIAQIYETQARSFDETENLVVYTDATVSLLRETIGSIDNSAVLTDTRRWKSGFETKTFPVAFRRCS
jgi:hypothetical protein